MKKESCHFLKVKKLLIERKHQDFKCTDFTEVSINFHQP